jgi:superfamily I DNA/RNA helicase/mRNA-degrading endonuclease RelE of RelBE toxin-antitoxin system
MSFELAFTRGFRNGLKTLRKELYPVIDRHIRSISADPYARDTNRTRMKNAPKTFRARIAADVRMLYRVIDQVSEIVFLDIGPRAQIYERHSGHASLLSADERAGVIAALRNDTPRSSAPRPAVAEEHVEAEELEWISGDELFLLRVPHVHWRDIIVSGSVEAMQRLDLDPELKHRIEDYWTNPRHTQVERLYSLGPGQDVAAVAQRPLREFLVMLDSDQKAALKRIKRDGPYLLKGGAGTGKSLVGLYHMRDLIVSRVGESMHDETPAQYGVITYTNTLVDANRKLLANIMSAGSRTAFKCTTLDKIAYRLSEISMGREPRLIKDRDVANMILDVIWPRLPPGSEASALLSKISPEYVAEEIEQTLLGNGLQSLQDYLAVTRRGRKRALRKEDREGIWAIYQELAKALEGTRQQTFAQLRVLALEYLRKNPGHERFTGLFVDEAQDLSKVARQMCLELVVDPRNLLLAADSGQSIYTNPPSWRQCDVRFNFQARRPIHLTRSYRATREILLAIGGLRLDPGDDDEQSADAAPVFNGAKPVWIDAPQNEHPTVVAGIVHQLVKAADHPINPGILAIIIREHSQFETYKTALQLKGVKAAFVNRDRSIEIDGDAVHVVTAHSSKGLGFPYVIVPEVTDSHYPPRRSLRAVADSDQREDMLTIEQRLLYVALSRAAHRLYMISDAAAPSPFLAKLRREAHWASS